MTLVLSYAEIPYDGYDKEIIKNELFKYEWLHLLRRFYRTVWEILETIEMLLGIQQQKMHRTGEELGFNKVSEQATSR